MEWEDTKENYVPVRTGRPAAVLSVPLSAAKAPPNEMDVARRHDEHKCRIMPC